jgi:hypothetical protein
MVDSGSGDKTVNREPYSLDLLTNNDCLTLRAAEFKQPVLAAGAFADQTANYLLA